MNVGDTISRYQILGRIGKGGMGEVFRALDTRLDRPVALKFLPRDGFTEASKQRFLNEARSAAKVRHPNICPIFDIEEADGELFIVMAYLEGETLQHKVSWRALEPVQLIDIATQVATGLAAAHDLGVVHRDIKSANIMIDPAGHAFLLDFGLALAPNSERVTHAGTSVGTPAYMSPEQIQGGTVDQRSDLWSLGVVMFEMAAGALPFRRDQSAAVIHAILHDPLPELERLRPGLPSGLNWIIAKALEKDPADRWQSAHEMLSALRRLSTTVPTPGSLATETIALPSVASSSSWLGGKRMALLAIGAVLLAGAAGVFYFKKAGGNQAVVFPIAAVKQVAVLPFDAPLNDDATASVAAGLNDILVSTLSDFATLQSGVQIVPSAQVRASSVKTPQQARAQLGASLALTGSAQPSGDKVEFTMKLVDTSNFREVSQQTLLYDPKNPVVSRDQAVALVARMMNLDVTPAARSAVTAGDTGAADAYSAYIEGRGFFTQNRAAGDVDRAIAKFKLATTLDPKYALAYAGLAEAYLLKALKGDQEAATLANQNAEYAVELDPSLARVHSVRGSVYRAAGRREEAIQEFKRAMDLSADNAEAQRELADTYNNVGRFKEAEDLYLRSTKARPTDWYGFLLLGVFYYQQERYAESEAALNQAKTLAPDNDIVRIDLGGVYRMHGRYAEAIQEYQQALRIRSNAATYAALAGVYYYKHQFKDAVAAAETAIDIDSNDYRYWGNLGIYARWTPGQEGKSSAALRRALEMAMKVEQTVKSEPSLFANLAEYRARLGDSKGALDEIERIPAGARSQFRTRLAIVYELTGHRDKAIEVVRANLKSPATLNQIKDDPDLAEVWRALNPR